MLCPKCQIQTNLFSVRRDNLKYEAFYQCPKCGEPQKESVEVPPVELCEHHLPIVVDVREIAEQMHIMYRCSKCFLSEIEIEPKYTKATCPGHQWEMAGTVFVDGQHSHSLDQALRCTRCGDIHYVPRDTDRAGLSGRIEIDHPEVRSTLLMNKSVWNRVIPKEFQDASIGKLPDKPIISRV